MLSALELAVRAAPDTGLALQPLATFLPFSVEIFGSATCWPLFQQLLAFAPPAQAAALITSIGKRLQLVVHVAAAQGGQGGGHGAGHGGGRGEGRGGGGGDGGFSCLEGDVQWVVAAVSLLPSPALQRQGAGAGAGAMPPGNLASTDRRGAGCGAGGRGPGQRSPGFIPPTLVSLGGRLGGGVGGGPGRAGSSGRRPEAAPPDMLQPHGLRLRLLLWHTLHRWLPALSRCLRLPQLERPEAAQLVAGPYTQVRLW